MISTTESGRVGYRMKYRVAGRVRVPAGHCLCLDMTITAAFCFNLDNQLHFCKGLSDMVAYDIDASLQHLSSVEPHCGIVAY